MSGGCTKFSAPKGETVRDREMDMSKPDGSPLQRYLRYLENGELAYQYSPAADRPVFFPRSHVRIPATRIWSGV